MPNGTELRGLVFSLHLLTVKFPDSCVEKNKEVTEQKKMAATTHSSNNLEQMQVTWEGASSAGISSDYSRFHIDRPQREKYTNRRSRNFLKSNVD